MKIEIRTFKNPGLKYITVLFLFIFSLLPLASYGQHNPYLDKKKKNRPSAVMARETRKDLKRGKRLAKKQMRKSKRSIRRADKRRARGTY